MNIFEMDDDGRLAEEYVRSDNRSLRASPRPSAPRMTELTATASSGRGGVGVPQRNHPKPGVRPPTGGGGSPSFAFAAGWNEITGGAALIRSVQRVAASHMIARPGPTVSVLRSRARRLEHMGTEENKVVLRRFIENAAFGRDVSVAATSSRVWPSGAQAADRADPLRAACERARETNHREHGRPRADRADRPPAADPDRVTPVRSGLGQQQRLLRGLDLRAPNPPAARGRIAAHARDVRDRLDP